MTVPHKHQVPREDRPAAADRATAEEAKVTLWVNPAVVALLDDEPHIVTLQAGEILFNEGDASASMFVVKRGTLRIGSGSGNVVHEDIGAGGIVGEMGVIDSHMPRSATVHALTGCELIELSQEHFLDLVERKPGFSISVMRVLSRRLRHMNEIRQTDTIPRPTSMRLGALELRFDINRAFWRGTEIDLTLTEFHMVSLLALRHGEDVSYRELYDLVHGKDFISGAGPGGYRGNVRTFIKRIRKKFRVVDPDFDQVHNYAGFGYQWIAA